MPIEFQIGIIGGTGLDDPDIIQDRVEVDVNTAYGKVRSKRSGCLFLLNCAVGYFIY